MTGLGGRLSAPVAVRLVDIDHTAPIRTGLSGYTAVLIFFRLSGAVAGSVLLPVIGGKAPENLLVERMDRIRAGPDHGTPPHPIGAAEGKNRSGQTVTVAVCTRDRSSNLRPCLQSLLSLELRPLEILVVDNCPSDDQTMRLVSEFPSVQYSLCRARGLNRARNHALKVAKGQIVAFTDDDVRVDPGWLGGIVPDFDDPMVAVTTGITLPAELETEPQIEFERSSSFTRGFRRRDFTLINSSPLHVSTAGSGANMAIRKALLNEIGLFDEHLDGGTPTQSGGDHEFLSRTLARGYRIVYSPAAIAWHYHRRTTSEAVRTMYGYGVGVFAWWTRSLVRERELSLLIEAPLCLVQHHLKRLVRSLLAAEDALPLRYTWAEFRGALVGPLSYIRSTLTITE